MATILVSHIHYVERKRGAETQKPLYICKRRKYLCLHCLARKAWQPSGLWNVLQMWCTVALCQWLVMLQQRQVTCTWTDKPQQCCSCRYCASGEERCRFELMLYRMLPHCRAVCSQTDKHCAVGVTQETFCNRRAPKAYEPRLSDVRYAEDRDCTNTQKERSKVPGCYLLHKQDATFDCTS